MIRIAHFCPRVGLYEYPPLSFCRLTFQSVVYIWRVTPSVSKQNGGRSLKINVEFVLHDSKKVHKNNNNKTRTGEQRIHFAFTV